MNLLTFIICQKFYIVNESKQQTREFVMQITFGFFNQSSSRKQFGDDFFQFRERWPPLSSKRDGRHLVICQLCLAGNAIWRSWTLRQRSVADTQVRRALTEHTQKSQSDANRKKQHK
jgi:hypothetical protein